MAVLQEVRRKHVGHSGQLLNLASSNKDRLHQGRNVASHLEGEWEERTEGPVLKKEIKSTPSLGLTGGAERISSVL